LDEQTDRVEHFSMGRFSFPDAREEFDFDALEDVADECGHCA
jgi:hypothetical protein